MNDLEDLAQGPMDQNDIEILGSLREMWDAVDPLPEGLTDRIQFAMSVASLGGSGADCRGIGGISFGAKYV